MDVPVPVASDRSPRAKTSTKNDLIVRQTRSLSCKIQQILMRYRNRSRKAVFPDIAPTYNTWHHLSHHAD